MQFSGGRCRFSGLKKTNRNPKTDRAEGFGEALRVKAHSSDADAAGHQEQLLAVV